MRPVDLALSRAAAMALALALASPAAASESDVAVFGVWRNAKETVHVDVRPCGEFACGFVIWATPEAQEKSMRASGRELIGLELFHNMVLTDAGWKGRTFVPDLNMTFTGFAQSLDGKTLRAKGCLIGGIVCRSQTWFRVD